MDLHNLDVAAITETWFSAGINDSEVARNGDFEVFRRDRDGHGGGVQLLVRKGIPCSEVMIDLISSELVSVDLVINDKPIRFICVYFSPTGDTALLTGRMEQLCTDLMKFMEIDSTVVVVGDFNLPLVKWDIFGCPRRLDGSPSKESLFLEMCSAAGWVQFVEAPTRLQSNTILDLVLSNDDAVGSVTLLPLSIIFRRSLEDGTVPELFRCAVVAPVHKKGSKSDPTNKRPVSMTPTACKLLECILSEAIYENADDQGLIFREQFAYRPKFSSVIQLLECQQDWAMMANASKCFDVVYFDFKSAFESVTHSKLIDLLPQYGVGTRLVCWISSFLSGRTFKVKVDNALSSSGHVTSGCPQGTILGPLMYILYTNSLMYIIPPNISVKVYADDVKLYGPAGSEEEGQLLQSALDKFYEWTLNLDLKLSVGKCAVVHFGHGNNQFQYTLNGDVLSKETVIRDLGVLISSNFKHSEHVTDVINRGSRTANWIRRSFVVKDPKLYLKLFDIYVLPLITYASPVWSPGLLKDQRSLQKMQRCFIRRVAFQCGVDKSSIEYKDILHTLYEADGAMFQTILADDFRAEKFFNVYPTTSRRGINVQPKCIATKSCINNLFSWRVSRYS